MIVGLAPLRGLRIAANRIPLSLYAVFAVLSLLFFFRLGHRELYSSHEARAAQNAQRMLDTGEWGLPVLFDGQADLQKPPGYYWLVAAAGWMNGGMVTAFEARLPAALAGLLTVLMIFAFLQSEGRPTAALVAAMSLATAIHFTAIARTARIDIPLTFAVTASLLAFCKALAPSRFTLLWVCLSAVAAAMGVMLKGPIALALIGPAALLWLLFSPRPAGSPRWKLSPAMMLLGTAIVFALAAPWFFWANRATHGEFWQVFFWHHNVERFTGGSPTLAAHPWWYYLPRFAADFLPWTPALMYLGVHRLIALRSEDSASRLNFGMVWFASMFVVLSASQFKRADYLLPLYPGAAIILGCTAESWLAMRSSGTSRLAQWLFGIVSIGTMLGWQVMTFAVEPAEQANEEKRAFAEMVRTQAPPPQEVMLFRAESHLLALHLGRPILTRVEWHDLNDWLAMPGPHFVVMPPGYVDPARQIVRSRKLVEVARLEDYTPGHPPRPLVFLRTE